MIETTSRDMATLDQQLQTAGITADRLTGPTCFHTCWSAWNVGFNDTTLANMLQKISALPAVVSVEEDQLVTHC